MSDEWGSEFKRRVQELCDERGTEMTDEQEEMLNALADQIDDWYDDRPKVAQGWLGD